MTMMKQFLDNSYLFGGNAPFIEDLYESYLVNPASVPEEWRDYFDKMQVLPGNDDACRFYAALGYRVEERISFGKTLPAA